MSTQPSERTAEERVSLTNAIYDAIEVHADEQGHAPLGDVVDTTRSTVPETAEDVHDRLELLQRHGEIYPVNGTVAITGARP